MLDDDLLARLLAEWQRYGVSWLSELRPALTEEDFVREVGAIGLRLPTEVRQLWRWFDVGDVNVALTPNYTLLQPRFAVRDYRDWREVAEDVASAAGSEPPRDDPDYYWPASYLPVLAGVTSDSAAVDCSTPESDESPLYYVEASQAFDIHEPRAPSIRAFLERVCDCYERDIYRWHPELHIWTLRAEDDPLVAPRLS
jgi:hypothetical protein